MTKRHPYAESTALDRIKRSVPAADFESILSKSSDPRAAHLLGMLLDPEYQSLKLATLCGKAGLYYEDVLLMLTRGRVGDGIEKMSRHAPKVFDDIGIDAESAMVNCSHCKGTGEIMVGKGKKAQAADCFVCEGVGKVRKPGDVDAREFMLKALKVIDTSKGGTNVQVNVGAAGVNSVEDDLGLVGEVIDVSVGQPQSE